MNSSIRLLTADDLPACDALRALAGWNQTLDDWRLFLTAQPDGCFVFEDHGRIIGTVTTICHGSALAWIGMMLVHPDERRRGIGRALMERCLAYLDERGVPCVKLDATPAGQPLYEQLGFACEWTLTRWSLAKSNASAPQTKSSCRPFAPNDLERIIALDAAAFGARREAVLRALVKRSRRVIVTETDGQLTGVGMLRAGSRANYLGPVVADSAATAESLIDELLPVALGENVFWDIPDANEAAVALAVARGFERVRPLTRMTRGQARCEQPSQRIFGIAGPAVG